jgi:hypothetical protein
MTRPKTVNQAGTLEERVSKARIAGLDALKRKDARWYLDQFSDPTTRAQKVTAVASHLWKENKPRRENYARYWSLYSNLPLAGLTPRKYSQRIAGRAATKLSLNAVAAVVDSYTAKVTNQRPRVAFSTSGGDWELQQKAQKLEAFNDGVIYENEAYEMGPLLEKDVGIFGTGIVKAYVEGEGETGRITYDRVQPFWVFGDDEEAQDGDPRTLYERRYMDRLRAMALWPEHAERLATVQREKEDYEDTAESDSKTDTVCVTEAFHLPSGKGRWGHGGTDTGDGMHVIVCGNVLLLEEPCTCYPYEFVYADRPENGIWGRGFAEQIQGIQFELNVLMNMVRQAYRVGGTLRWLYESNSQLNYQFISDIIGSGIKYTGPDPPTPITPPAVAPEVYAQIDRLWQKAFEVPGISQLSATSMAPQFEESGKAKQLRLDTESERFQVAIHQYWHLFLRLARQNVRLAAEHSANDNGFAVRCISRETMTTVRWAEAHMDEKDYALKLYAVSAFEETPEARLEQVQETLASGTGLITVQEGRRLLNDPDLKEYDSYADASYDLTMSMIGDILSRGEYAPPEPEMDLDDAIKRAQFAYLKARRLKAPEDRLEMLLQWIQQCKDSKPAPAPMAAPAPAAQAGPAPMSSPGAAAPPQGLAA